jgi:galactonate dehydratase
MAHSRFSPVTPQNPTGPAMNAMTLHLAASIPNFCILETIAVDVPWRKEIVRESPLFSNSKIKIPHVPGLGLDLPWCPRERAPRASEMLPKAKRSRSRTRWPFWTASLRSRRCLPRFG